MKHIRWKGGERVRTKLMEEGEMKREIEDEMMEEEREIRERTKAVESIENIRIEGCEGVGVKITKQEDDGMVSKNEMI